MRRCVAPCSLLTLADSRGARPNGQVKWSRDKSKSKRHQQAKEKERRARQEAVEQRLNAVAPEDVRSHAEAVETIDHEMCTKLLCLGRRIATHLTVAQRHGGGHHSSRVEMGITFFYRVGRPLLLRCGFEDVTIKRGVMLRSFYKSTQPETLEKMFVILPENPLPGLRTAEQLGSTAAPPTLAEEVEEAEGEEAMDDEDVFVKVNEEHPARVVYSPTKMLLSLNFFAAVMKRSSGYEVGSAPMPERVKM